MAQNTTADETATATATIRNTISGHEWQIKGEVIRRRHRELTNTTTILVESDGRNFVFFTESEPRGDSRSKVLVDGTPAEYSNLHIN